MPASKSVHGPSIAPRQVRAHAFSRSGTGVESVSREVLAVSVATIRRTGPYASSETRSFADSSDFWTRSPLRQ